MKIAFGHLITSLVICAFALPAAAEEAEKTKKPATETPKIDVARPVGPSAGTPGKEPLKSPSFIRVSVANLANPDSVIPTVGAGQGSHEFTVSDAGDHGVTVQQQPANTQLVAAAVPLKGVKVILCKSPSTGTLSTKFTNQNGGVVFKGLAPGKYTVTLDDVSATKAPGAGPKLPATKIQIPVPGSGPKPPAQ